MKTFKEFISLDESSIANQIDDLVENETHRAALNALYESLNADNKEKFQDRLETDIGKLIEFAMSKFQE